MSAILLRQNIPLIGYMSNVLGGSKLPSNKEVIKVLFFNLRAAKHNLRESAKLVIEEVLIFWNKARIPTKQKCHCITKLIKLYNDWLSLRKSSQKVSEYQKNKEKAWVENLDLVFDVAHANALDMIKIEEDKAFLISQRQKGRPGFMYGIDYATLQKENEIEHRHQTLSERVDRTEREKNILSETVQFESSSENSESFQSPEPEDVFYEVPAKKFKGKQKIMTSKLAIALDYCKISDRNAVHIICAVLESLGKDIADFTINRSSIRIARANMRKERAIEFKKQFKVNNEDILTLHWDGKLLPALTGNENVDRLPIVIASGEIEQLLEVPAIKSSSGKEQADSVYNIVCKWGLQNDINCLVFDTTAINTGRLKGTCTLLEKSLNRELLWLPCRHHIYEILLKSAFETKFDCSTGPFVKLFENFRKSWKNLNKNNWQSGIQDEMVSNHLQGTKCRIINFIKSVLQEKQPREDYKELLELVLLFLGENIYKSNKSILIRSPGAFHHARWMSKAIYSLKIFLLRKEYRLLDIELAGLRQICIFIITVYIEAWYSAPSAIKAPNTDLKFLISLHNFKQIDENISDVCLKKFLNHLWYLGSESIALAFFDNNVSAETKQKMKAKMENDNSTKIIKRVILKKEDITDVKGLEQFVCSKTNRFFERLNIDRSFLDLHPSIWPTHDAYKSALKKINNLKVVNDVAERGVKLIEEYNKLLTKNEEQKQFILQVVSAYRKRFPNANKSTLLQKL